MSHIEFTNPMKNHPGILIYGTSVDSTTSDFLYHHHLINTRKEIQEKLHLFFLNANSTQNHLLSKFNFIENEQTPLDSIYKAYVYDTNGFFNLLAKQNSLTTHSNNLNSIAAQKESNIGAVVIALIKPKASSQTINNPHLASPLFATYFNLRNKNLAQTYKQEFKHHLDYIPTSYAI